MSALNVGVARLGQELRAPTMEATVGPWSKLLIRGSYRVYIGCLLKGY